ncbi:MAG TPA: type IV pili twitching motility protein PilT, partial [Clostridiaceae bacterium]|nr:type IV pili twitching motility protein PilT [Clostridiaceae bacterium]HCL51270.1 type IV pili twitching motility protein PilT [Clostridiaceae bacterium]
MITFEDLLKKASEMNASDVHLTVGIPPIMRINGNLVPFGEDKFTPKEIEKCVKEILNEDQLDKYNEFGEIDLSYSLNGVGRFRINIFRQRGSSAIALRTVPLQVPTLDKLGMPQIIKDLTKKTRG